MTKPIANPTTNPPSSNALANSGHALDWKAFSACRALIAHVGPQLLAALFNSVELPEPTPRKGDAPPVPPLPERDRLLFVAIRVWSRAVDEVVPQPEASAL